MGVGAVCVVGRGVVGLVGKTHIGIGYSQAHERRPM
jgi:hypothetical protein